MKDYREKLVDIVVNAMMESMNQADFAHKIKYGYVGVDDLSEEELESEIWERFGEGRSEFEGIADSEEELSMVNEKFCEWIKKTWRPVDL